MIKNKYSDRLHEVVPQFSKGYFMVVKQGSQTNVITLGWGTVGLVWNRPIFQIMVSTSRHSYELLEKSQDFSLCFPLRGQLKKEIGLCGSKSGRDMDKVEHCGFELKPGLSIDSPIIGGCDQYYECRIVAKQKMPVESLDGDNGEDDNYHVMYYAEIVESYTVEL